MSISRSKGGRHFPFGAVAVVVLLVLAGWLAWDALGDRTGSPAPSPTPTAGAANPTPLGTAAVPEPTLGDGVASPTPTAPADPTPSADATPTPEPSPTVVAHETEMAFVPVVSFWSDRTDISLEQLGAAARGEGRPFGSLVVPAGDGPVVAEMLGLTDPGSLREMVPADLLVAVRGGELGIIRVTDVTPAVRALAVDGMSLFGNDRLTDLRDWPMRATVLHSAVDWDQAANWTLVAAGDILLDRGVAQQVFTNGRGVDHPFDGGTARITRIRCCSSFGWPVPTTEKTGNRGAVRELLSGGDIAIANLESSVVPNAPLASGGLRFRGRPEMLDGIRDAGFDFMSLANNHIGDGGQAGILNAISELEARDIAHAGVGRTAAEARQPAILDVNGQTVAILACDAIAKRYHVKPDKVGSQDCRDERLVDEIQVTSETADVVIVFPHWGREYRAAPRPYQRQLAADWTAAGADLVIGAHSHWAGGIEDIDGRLVFYSLGNFVFDQTWQTETQLGLILELTFQGDRLAQAWLHPTLMVEAQPNLINTAEDRQRVIDQVREGSEGLLPY
jgi:poly-gamma-glutamate capsule biosynthesis protein CapA/YwtB (metallophosphatase superfamily)